jgi:flagellar hook-associated protein 1
MPDIYGILNLGREAILTQQKAVDVTGHNIANVNTPGYSRQRVNMETNTPISFSPGQMGTGVRATEIQRIYDRFLGTQINNENQDLGRWEARKGVLERVEMILDESEGYGLNNAMSEFWNAWQDLTNNPSGSAERVALLNKSEILADGFQKVRSDIVQIQKDIDTIITGTVEEINLVSDEIAHLNRKISQTEANGQNANDYRDERDLLVKQLSEMIAINTYENSDGKVTVLAGGGRPLVENVYSWNLSTATNASGFQDVVVLDGDGNQVNITDDISAGKLRGWIEARDEAIPDYLDRLDTLASSIMSQVNAVHGSGFGLSVDPSTGLPYAGGDFFTGTSAADMSVASDIINDTNRIAASSTREGVPGDNGNAVAMANLQNVLTMNGNTSTFDTYYNSMVTDIGIEVRKAESNFDHQTSMVAQLDNYRESVSGVSLDEEMVNLIKFQHAYDAAAKLISTTDELLVTIINMV